MATAGDDVLTGTAGGETLDGLDGSDTIDTGGGADVVSGGAGSDTISGGDGDDILYGFGAADRQADSGVIDATRVAAGLSRPLYAASPPGDPDRLFVVEQHTGRVMILELGSNTVRAMPFLDLPAGAISTGGEQGLLGLAFHPDYAANGRFFLHLTNAAGRIEVWEHRRSADPDVADLAAGRLVISFDHPFANHNAGWIGFGPDGYLYVTSGDGGGAGDPNNNAQNLDSLLGKILRLDVNADAFPGDDSRNYAIPADNPFVGRAGTDEIWAYGLRNPWRMSFDSNGDVYIGDVGQGAREEIDYRAAGASKGANFGWKVLEGTGVFDAGVPGNPAPNDPSLVAPVAEYARALGQSVTGGYVYRGPGGAQGHYVFGDFVSGRIWTLRVTDGRAVDFLQRNEQLRVDAGDIDQIASFAVDGRGRLYLIGLDGDIHRLTPSEAAADGPDRLAGGEGADSIWGGAGADRLLGEGGADALWGGIGDDVLEGGEGDDLMLGNPGADLLQGGAGRDSMFGGQGADTLSGGLEGDYVLGDREEDRLNGDEGADTLSGGDGADRLDGGADADAVFGGPGADTLDAGLGPDFAAGDEGADVITNAGGRDLIFGGAGDDTLRAGPDGDILLGNQDADRLFGGAGPDTLFGGQGSDTLIGGAGADLLLGDLGADRIVFTAVSDSPPGAADRVTGFAPGEDLIDLSAIDARSGTPEDDAFLFAQQFTGQAGQAVLSYDAGSDTTTLRLDVNGDGVSDMDLLIGGRVDGATGFVL